MNKRRYGSQRLSSAFTLLELLVVIGIIVVLASLIFSSWKGVMKGAQKSEAIANVKKELSIWSIYAGDHDGKLMPVSGTWPDDFSDTGYWMYWMKEYAPGETDYLTRKYGFLLSPSKGPLEAANGFLALNIFMGPSTTAQNASSFTLARIKHPSKTVVFADSIWDVFAHSYYGESSLTFRYDNDTSSVFGMADGHVETVVTRDPAKGGKMSAITPKGYYYTLDQDEPSL